MQSDEFDVGSDDDAQNQARMQRREAFFATLGPLPLAELASSALSECTKRVEARLKSEPPRGLEDDVASAWDEAALVVTADGHPMRDVVVQELGGLADEALARLSLAQRRAVWAHVEPHEAAKQGDLWDRSDAEQFDPIRGWPGCLDEANERIVRRVIHSLVDTAQT